MRGFLRLTPFIRHTKHFKRLTTMATLTVKQGIDPELQLSRDTQILLVGKKKLLKNIKFDGNIMAKFSGFVTSKTWDSLMETLAENSSTIPLHLNLATVIAVGDESSRHNAPSNALSIFKEVKKAGQIDGIKNVSIILYAMLADVFPSVAAIARCYPLYSRLTENTISLENVQIEIVVTGGEKLTNRDLLFLQTLTESIRNTARLIDMPHNELNTEQFVAEATELILTLPNIQSTIIKGNDLLEKGFGGIYHVGKASASPPIFACFSHKPPNATKTYAMVGKGIVYDTGGMQIKTKTLMPGMKNDMGGAAALLGSFYTLVKLGFKQNLHCLLCVADNTISHTANRPDDIITMLSGKTVEITNTDAEGRLVLADGVYYAKNMLKADTIIDMATLTGAQGLATGKLHAAVLTNSEEWENRACKAGRASGDLVHPLPFCPDLHFSDLKSPVADMRNSTFSKMQGPGSSIAGLFIASHIDFGSGLDWIHFDIAFPVENCNRATGYGPALICALLASHLDVPLLKTLQ
uniref:Cytosol aminopeptidase domain-containing protein n=2 Tax=Wuchereria bancrofti TaxID=6293 RepID=A0AAF5PLV5_WUCBA